jgi:hypothetical protein
VYDWRNRGKNQTSGGFLAAKVLSVCPKEIWHDHPYHWHLAVLSCQSNTRTQFVTSARLSRVVMKNGSSRTRNTAAGDGEAHGEENSSFNAR